MTKKRRLVAVFCFSAVNGLVGAGCGFAVHFWPAVVVGLAGFAGGWGGLVAVWLEGSPE